MADIPQYNIIPQNRYQPTSIKDKLGALNTTPANIGRQDQESAVTSLNNKAAVNLMDKTINKGANVNTESAKQAQAAKKIDTGKNTLIMSKSDIAKAIGGAYPQVEDINLDANTVKVLQKQLESIQQSNKSVPGPNNVKAEVPIGQRKSTDDWVKVNINKDGTASVENYGVWDKLTGRTYGNSYNTDWKPDSKMFLTAAAPLLTYSNAVGSMDRLNQLIFGTKTIGQVLDAARGGPGKNILTDNGVMAIANIADMTHNWGDRNKIQQAQSVIDSLLSTADYLGYETGEIVDGYSLFTFGYGAYEVSKNWDKMNDAQRSAATFYLTLAGSRAYTGAENLYDWAVQAGWLEGTAGNMSLAPETINSLWNAGGAAATLASAGEQLASGAVNATNANAFTQAAFNADALGKSAQSAYSIASNTAADATEATQAAWNAGATGGEAASESVLDPTGATTAIAAMYSSYDAYKSWDNARKQFGHGSADSRKAMARTVGDIEQAAGTAIGATLGATCFGSPTIGAAVGSFVGRLTGTVDGLVLGSIKTGKSAEQRRRDTWRTVFSQAGIFYRAPLSADDSSKTYAIKLADGSYYDVGTDGSGSRALMKDGSVKTIANPTLIAKGDKVRESGELSPYDVDYTNALDFGASLMLNGMIMPIGGSTQKNRSKEVGQMLGYMTNGVTSNCGREFTQDNWNTLVSNIRLQYSNVGITSKSLYSQSLAEAYYTGRLSYDDYQTGLMTMGWIFDEDGYQQAARTLGALNKLNGQTITSGSTGVAAPSPITGDTREIA